jgi:hypothetical protein
METVKNYRVEQKERDREEGKEKEEKI